MSDWKKLTETSAPGEYVIGDVFIGLIDALEVLAIAVVAAQAVPRAGLLAALGVMQRQQEADDRETRPGRRVAIEALLRVLSPPDPAPKLAVVNGGKGAPSA
jgi:hypothetical protein